MAMTLLEKILAAHSKYETVRPGEIVDIEIDFRVATGFRGSQCGKKPQGFWI